MLGASCVMPTGDLRIRPQTFVNSPICDVRPVFIPIAFALPSQIALYGLNNGVEMKTYHAGRMVFQIFSIVCLFFTGIVECSPCNRNASKANI